MNSERLHLSLNQYFPLGCMTLDHISHYVTLKDTDVFWNCFGQCKSKGWSQLCFVFADSDTMDVHCSEGIPWRHLPQLEARFQRWTNHVLSASSEEHFSYQNSILLITKWIFYYNAGLTSLFLYRQVNWRSITPILMSLPWSLLDSATILTTEEPTICTRQSKTFIIF